MNTQSKIAVVAGIVLGLIVLIANAGYIERFIQTDAEFVGLTDLPEEIVDLEAQLANGEDNYQIRIRLALAYLEHAQLVTNTDLYERASIHIDRAGVFGEPTADFYALRAQYALGVHNFNDAYADAAAAVQMDPYTARYYGILGDAEIELGQYESAADSYQIMVDLRPDYSAFTRIAYIRELFGDREGALAVLTQARNAVPPEPRQVAWLMTQQARLIAPNDLTLAEKILESALSVDPGNDRVLAAQAAYAYFRDDVDTALSRAHEAFDASPSSVNAALLGDLYSLAGNTDAAEQQYTLTELAFESSQAKGVNIDYEYATFLSQRNRNDTLAASLNDTAFELRPDSLLVATTRARILYNENRFANAFYTLEPFMEEGGLGRYSPEATYLFSRINEALLETENANAFMDMSRALDPFFSILEGKALGQE